MKYSVLAVIWVLALFKGHVSANMWAHQDYAESTFDLDQAALTQVFKRTVDGSSQSQQNHYTCNTWGVGAFKRFNNEFFHFTSTCDLIMSMLNKRGLDDYEVKIRRGSDGILEHIFIKIETTEIVVTNGTIKVKDQIIHLPYDDKVVNVRSNGINIKFSNKKHSVALIWNRKDALSLKLHPKYSGNVWGLCGNFENIGRVNGKFIKVSDVSLREYSVTSGSCPIKVSEDGNCDAAREDLITSCIKPFSTHFTSCDDYTSYFTICQRDVCASPIKYQAKCFSLTEIAHLCPPPTSQKNWRDTSGCEKPDCPENQIYMDCGQAIIPTCTDPKPQQPKDACVNTCECPKDTVLDNINRTNKCIEKSKCPCEYSGKIYKVGERRQTSCQTW